MSSHALLLVHRYGGMDRIGIKRRIFLGHGQEVGDVAGLLGAAASKGVTDLASALGNLALDLDLGAGLRQEPVKLGDAVPIGLSALP